MTRRCLLKGIEREMFFSRIIHSKERPLLISSKLLRKRGCGQIDISSFKLTNEKSIVIYEAKSSGIVSNIQRKRLLNATELLASIFKVNTRIQIL